MKQILVNVTFIKNIKIVITELILVLMGKLTIAILIIKIGRILPTKQIRQS
jgi:hypothetical protein